MIKGSDSDCTISADAQRASHIATRVTLFPTLSPFPRNQARGGGPSLRCAYRLDCLDEESGFYFLLPSILTLSVALKTYLCHWFVTQDEPEPAIRKSYQAVERHGETIRVRDTVLLKSGPRKTSTPYVAKISALWENPESGTCSSDWELKEQLPSVGPCLEFCLAQDHHSWQSLPTLHPGSVSCGGCSNLVT
jgi:hypothetical protein